MAAAGLILQRLLCARLLSSINSLVHARDKSFLKNSKDSQSFVRAQRFVCRLEFIAAAPLNTVAAVCVCVYLSICLDLVLAWVYYFRKVFFNYINFMLCIFISTTFTLMFPLLRCHKSHVRSLARYALALVHTSALFSVFTWCFVIASLIVYANPLHAGPLYLLVDLALHFFCCQWMSGVHLVLCHLISEIY